MFLTWYTCVWYNLYIGGFYLYSQFFNFCILIYLLKIKLHDHVIRGPLLQLSTENLKSQCPTKGGWCSSPSLMLSVPWWHICWGKSTFELFLRSLVSLRLWACTVLCGSVLLLIRQTPIYSSPFYLLWENSEWPFYTQALRANSGTHRGNAPSYSFKLHPVCVL